ncbi:hypothetical protein [Kitasatospora sp. NPDC004289]
MLANERAVGLHVGSDRLIRAGLDALLAGVESPSIPLLAGLGRTEEPEARELFDRVLDELGLSGSLPADPTAARLALARLWAEQIVDGSLDPATGADKIWAEVACELGYPDELQPVVRWAIVLEDWNEDWDITLAEIDTNIVQAAREVLAIAGALPDRLDHRLVGHWSSLPLSYGVMEASELAFLPDGRGWSTWFNVGGLCVTRFTWWCPEPGVLELSAQWMVQGTPRLDPGPPAFASTEPAERLAEVTRHRYVIGSAVPVPGAEPLSAVSFEEPVESCFEYARGSAQIRPEEDPTHRVMPYE